MKMYKLLTQNNGRICIYSDNNELKCLKLWRQYRPYMDNDKLIDEWESVHIYTDSPINKRKKYTMLCIIMSCIILLMN